MRVVSLRQAQYLKGQLKSWAYNALDCTGTLEIANVLLPRLDPETERTYAFERAVQNAAFQMQCRGVRVDVVRRDEAVAELGRELKKTTTRLNKLPAVADVWDGLEKVTGKCKKSTRKDDKHTWEPKVPDTPERTCVNCGMSRFKTKPFNPNSPLQTQHLFYDLLNFKPLKNKKGEISTDDEIIGRLEKIYPEHSELFDAIQEYRNFKKQLGFLKSKLSGDNRFHSSFNVGTAWTGRWSSSKDPFQRGSNLQNIAERHRNIFVADPGFEIAYIDLKQAESNGVAHLAGDEIYIDAHKSGDVHTFVTRLIWPEMPWTMDLSQDKKIAKALPEWDQAPGHDFRFQSKRIQHGGNYGLTPFGISRIARIPLSESKRAYYAYHGSFPYINGWQGYVRGLVEASEPLVNPLQRKIRLFGRPWDDHTYKQGLAFLPQSMVADIINIAIYRVWKELEPEGVQLFAQVHDALLLQFPKGRYDLVARAMDLMTIPVEVMDYEGNVRVMRIEAEAAVGLNWGHKSADNPQGIDEQPIQDYLNGKIS